MTIREYIIKDIQQAMAALQQAGTWPIDLQVPVPEISSTEPHMGDVSSTIALQLIHVFQKNPLHIAEDIKSALQQPYAQVRIVQPGFLYITLAEEQWEASVREIVSAGESYGKVEQTQKERICIEGLSTFGVQPLQLHDMRVVYHADALLRAYHFLGYRADMEYRIRDVGVHRDIFGESVMRTYFRQKGMNVPYAEMLYRGQYITELAQTIDLAFLDRLPLHAIEEGKKQVRALAYDTWCERIRTEIEANGVGAGKWVRDSQQEGCAEYAERALKARGALYEEGGVRYVRTSQYGDESDRVYTKPQQDAALCMYHDICLQYRRTCDDAYTRVVIFLAPDRQGYAQRLSVIPQMFGVRAHVQAVRVGMTQTRYVQSSGDDCAWQALPAEALKWHLLSSPLEAQCVVETGSDGDEATLHYWNVCMKEYATLRASIIDIDTAQESMSYTHQEKNCIQYLESWEACVRSAIEQQQAYPITLFCKELVHMTYAMHQESIRRGHGQLVRAVVNVAAIGFRLLGVRVE